ncbi:DMT family transporter [uncultured Shewanella sp.]|uniref:DMT family transporter n=1 Tax=uncultured Shewanella sp. TaxID=173975 RepID=UPI00262D917D|nr:DMT family transporter [uncultured Shewanella sp.]
MKTVLKQVSNKLMALLAGGLLALMIEINSELAFVNSPIQASWIAHGVGAFVAMCLVLIVAFAFQGHKRNGLVKTKGIKTKGTKTTGLPYWLYLGGLPGALTVVLAGITVNSDIGLSGTLSSALIGQIIFGIISDHFGLFGSQKKPFVAADLLKVLPVLAGSFIIIFT